MFSILSSKLPIDALILFGYQELHVCELTLEKQGYYWTLLLKRYWQLKP